MHTHQDSSQRHRDGTGQAERHLAALDPEYVLVDERRTRDLLAFAQRYAKDLKYFNERNEVHDDENWSAFLAGDVDEMAAYLKDPGQFQNDPEKQDRFSRPHFALFLTFLELLKHAQTQLNDLTRRHLEFYYREALRLTSKNAVADKVHVLVDLVDNQPEFLLPKGTLFIAGQDSQGEDLCYKTDDEIVANQARVESLKSLFVEKKVIGIRGVHQRPEVIGVKDPFLAMLKMVFGKRSGDKLPAFPGDKAVDKNLFAVLDKLLKSIESELCMRISVFRTLMQLKRKLASADTEWNTVNAILDEAGATKREVEKFELKSKHPQDFEGNLKGALGLRNDDELKHLFDGLADVDDVHDLYRHLSRPASPPRRKELEDSVNDKLFLQPDEFERMMLTVNRIHRDWRHIADILRAAGHKRDKTMAIERVHPRSYVTNTSKLTYAENKFNLFVSTTLPDITVDSLDDYYKRIENLETYFGRPAEDYALVRKISAKDKPEPWEWEQVSEILEAVHHIKVVFPKKRNTLEDKRKKSFDVMIQFALGHPQPGNDFPESKPFMQLNPDGNREDKEFIRNKLCLEVRNFEYIKDTQTRQTKLPKPPSPNNTTDSQNSIDIAWENVYRMLDRAQWRISGHKGPHAVMEEWRGISAATDAKSVVVQTGLEDEQDLPRWRTFGEAYLPTEEKLRSRPARLGLTVASPLLALSEASRTITLTLRFRKDSFNKKDITVPIPFRFYFSTAEKMVKVTNMECKVGKDLLTITLRLDEQAAAVAPLVTDPDSRTPWPQLQMLLDHPLNSDDEEVSNCYGIFHSARLEKVSLSVDVKGIRALSLQNDDAVLDAKKPFEPFGASPLVGSSFYFAHPELCSKKLDALTLDVVWMGVPPDLPKYYAHYTAGNSSKHQDSPIASNADFSARLKLHDNRRILDIASIPLFQQGEVTATADSAEVVGSGTKFKSELKVGGAIRFGGQEYNVKRMTSDTKLTIEPKATKEYSGAFEAVPTNWPITQEQLKKVHPGYLPETSIATDEQVLNWERYWQLELNAPDFQHSVYPKAAAKAASKIDTSKSPPVPAPVILNPPYTPKIKSLAVGYSASVDIDLCKSNSDSTEQLYYVEPFGERPIAKDSAGLYPLLPQYTNEGELYIGVRDLATNQNLSLLFQIADGSADPDLQPETVHWSYLTGNRWQSLEKEGRIIDDGTNGLLHTGIIKFHPPPAKPNTLLPPNLYWIRASIANNSRGVGDMVGIHAQAVTATFENRGNSPDHLNQPLPVESITDLAEPQPEVKAIGQPYSSFGGRGPELASRFYTRVSERLRHKNRALTSWDYERLILEEFPEVYKVKCLPVGTSDDPRLVNCLRIIVIPNLRGKHPFNPFEPKCQANTLVKIEQYLRRHAPPLARFRVQNPRYLHLKVRFAVRFAEGCNTGYYERLLNEELRRHLAPWAYDDSADIVLGGKIHASLIVDFVDRRRYVDYLAGIRLFTSLDGEHFKPVEFSGTEASVAAESDTVLVSVRQHTIIPITEQHYEDEYFVGINYMVVQEDFQIS